MSIEEKHKYVNIYRGWLTHTYSYVYCSCTYIWTFAYTQTCTCLWVWRLGDRNIVMKTTGNSHFEQEIYLEA